MLRNSLLFLFLLLALVACRTPQDVVFWQDATAQQPLAQNKPTRIPLAAGDRVSIVVSSVATPKLAISYNKILVAMRAGGRHLDVAQSLQPYVLDKEGYVSLPDLGAVKLGGLTRTEAADHIARLLRERKLLRDANVQVKVTNQYVSVLGEVNEPGRVNFDREALTLPEALALSGDVSIKANRRQVLVLRDSLGQVSTHRIDLTNAQGLYASPAYYLQPGDVVYVLPSKYRQREAQAYGNVWGQPYIYMSLVSVLTSVMALLFAL